MKRLFAGLAEIARASPGELGLVVLLAATVVGGGAFVYARTASQPPPPPIEKIERAEPSPAAGLVVHVAGVVRTPGLYELPVGSRVQDALNAAGGPLDGADLDALNLAEILSDGVKIYVPKKGEGAAPGAEGPTRGAKLNLNAATEAELEALPGIGPVLAQRIVAYRQKKGRFTSLRQLMEVEGIGQKKYEALRDLLTI